MFQEVSEGQFTERIAPYLMQAAPFAGVDRLPFQQALQNAVQDKRKVLLPVPATCLAHPTSCTKVLIHKLSSQPRSRLEWWSCMPLSCLARMSCLRGTVVATHEAASGNARNSVGAACRL